MAIKKNFWDKLVEAEGIENIFHDPHNNPKKILHRIKLIIPIMLFVGVVVLIFINSLAGKVILIGTVLATILSWFGYHEIRIKDKLMINKLISMILIVVGGGLIAAKHMRLTHTENTVILWVMLLVGLTSFFLIGLVKKKLH